MSLGSTPGAATKSQIPLQPLRGELPGMGWWVRVWVGLGGWMEKGTNSREDASGMR